MSVIQMVEASSGGYVVFCPACMKSIGELSGEEVRGLLLAGIEPYCFDCDSSRADKVPGHLILDQETYLVGIGNRIFLVEYAPDFWEYKGSDFRFCNVSFATYFDLKTGRGPAYVPFSSSLNLHGNIQKTASFLDDR